MPRRIYITGPERLKLMGLIDKETDDTKNKDYVRGLYRDLMRANIVSAAKLPSDIILMNSQVLLSLDGEEDEVRLMYPHEADASRNMISVLSPLGASIYGCREGDAFECSVAGVKKIEIKGVYTRPSRG